MNTFIQQICKYIKDIYLNKPFEQVVSKADSPPPKNDGVISPC